ncbi:Creatininase [Ancylobacter novellus DSM 506]|uniref:Creatininase n=1 Tax=Ancylobacter novellus (strain ATCC 8093 / DSM 506 / JCM 20403 / CCM 1077 / IAM 12100 / NBRC 12443 / NCIMB 10456) TaxID=639283 RepID=D7A278_ANCN5|nr:creatininase [Ancylobacter novellus]ADH89541.1 Creatininase [Ancylobacter novellus DSM 506]
MVDSVRLDELSWPEFKAKVAAGAPVLLPLGSTEQHGPHLPLNVDVVLPTGVCERVAREVGGLVAPTVNYGCKSMPRSGGGEQFPGTLSLDANTFALVVRDVIRNLVRQGVRRLVVVNGHYENCWPSVEGLDLALRELKSEGVDDLVVMRLEYWDFAQRATLDRLFPEGFPGIDLEHASLLETSLMLVLRPELVEMDKAPTDGPAKFPPYDRFPVPDDFGLPPSGVLAVATGSTAEKGEWLMADYVTRISAAMRKEFGM